MGQTAQHTKEIWRVLWISMFSVQRPRLARISAPLTVFALEDTALALKDSRERTAPRSIQSPNRLFNPPVQHMNIWIPLRTHAKCVIQSSSTVNLVTHMVRMFTAAIAWFTIIRSLTRWQGTRSAFTKRQQLLILLPLFSVWQDWSTRVCILDGVPSVMKGISEFRTVPTAALYRVVLCYSALNVRLPTNWRIVVW